MDFGQNWWKQILQTSRSFLSQNFRNQNGGKPKFKDQKCRVNPKKFNDYFHVSVPLFFLVKSGKTSDIVGMPGFLAACSTRFVIRCLIMVFGESFLDGYWIKENTRWFGQKVIRGRIFSNLLPVLGYQKDQQQKKSKWRRINIVRK